MERGERKKKKENGGRARRNKYRQMRRKSKKVENSFISFLKLRFAVKQWLLFIKAIS